MYPVKSLRGIAISEAHATRHGFDFDRTFMLLKCEPQDDMPHTNMHLPSYPEMMLFTTALKLPEDNTDRGRLIITYTNPETKETTSISSALRPDYESLDTIPVKMHGASCQGYRVGKKYDEWFSTNFGYNVIFVYLGPSWRPVLMSTDNDAPRQASGPATKARSWLSTLSSYIAPGYAPEAPEITFADCAPYLVCSEASCQQVTTRLDGGEEMQIIKFRPNIVVAGANSAWEEDYWNEIAISPATSGAASQIDAVHISLPQNCGRCASINIDYSTGKPGTTSSGQVLKRLQKDRRVDVGMKYSPIFGRYGFASRNAGQTIRVGDEVEVVKRNAEHTKFDWPGITTLK